MLGFRKLSFYWANKVLVFPGLLLVSTALPNFTGFPRFYLVVLFRVFMLFSSFIIYRLMFTGFPGFSVVWEGGVQCGLSGCLPSFTEFPWCYLVIFSFTGFYLVLLGF